MNWQCSAKLLLLILLFSSYENSSHPALISVATRLVQAIGSPAFTQTAAKIASSVAARFLSWGKKDDAQELHKLIIEQQQSPSYDQNQKTERDYASQAYIPVAGQGPANSPKKEAPSKPRSQTGVGTTNSNPKAAASPQAGSLPNSSQPKPQEPDFARSNTQQPEVKLIFAPKDQLLLFTNSSHLSRNLPQSIISMHI